MTHYIKTEQIDFIPPFCPNHLCQFHQPNSNNFWARKGRSKIKRYPGFNLKYQCKHCHRHFSYSSFFSEYRRRSNPFKAIFNSVTQGMSNRAIARTLEISEHKVRNCIKFMARQALLKMEAKMEGIAIHEPLAYDGFETFSYSQYDPNNINNLVGKKSLFVYDFNFSHLNRKGKMTDFQKKKLKKIESLYGRYPSNRIRVQTKKIFERLNDVSGGPVNLFTDEHKSYQLVLRKDLQNHQIEHSVINSKRYRNAKNPLFPVNHLDMMYRHFLKSCTRETIGFNKNEAGLMDRVILFIASKNFMRSKFIKGPKSNNQESPAMIVGIAEKIMKFHEFFGITMTKHQVKLRKEWDEFYHRTISCCRYNVAAYQGN